MSPDEELGTLSIVFGEFGSVNYKLKSGFVVPSFVDVVVLIMSD